MTMEAMEEKLNSIMATLATKKDLENVATKQDIAMINGRIDDLAVDFNQKIDVVNGELAVQKETVVDNSERIAALEVTTEELREVITTLTSKLKTEKALADLKSRNRNLLIFGPEDDNPNETVEESIEEIRKFLKNVLKLPNADDVIIADGHRLRLRKQRSSRSKLKRPLIFKVISVTDRNRIVNLAKDTLSAYNNANGCNYYIKRHLPKQMQDQKKKLTPAYKKAVKAKKEAKFQINFETGDYCLYINNELYTG